MNPRKKRPVLYELVARSQRSRGWSGAARPTSSRAQPSPPTTGPTPATTGSTAHDQDSYAPDRAVRISDGRLRLTLGWGHILVAAAFLGALGAGAYLIGQRTPPNTTPSDLSSILTAAPETDAPATDEPTAPGVTQQPMGRGAITPPRPGRPAEAESEAPPPPPVNITPPEPFDFESGRYYVVAQFFRRRDRDAAYAAQRFLQSEGVACIVHQGPLKDWWVVADESFASSDAARNLIDRIKEAGKTYAKDGNGYDFAECQARKF